MNWDQIRGNWMQDTGLAREPWGKPVGDDMQAGAGRPDPFAGGIRQRHSATAQDAGQPQGADNWLRRDPPRP